MVQSKEELDRLMKNLIRERSDLSTFLVHLTKDDSAKNSLINILNSKIINKGDPKGLCSAWKDFQGNPDPIVEHTKSVCFTETPLCNIKYLLDIPWRNINLKSYGLVFSKEYLRDKGANPIFYINTYANSELKSFFSHLNHYKNLVKDKDGQDKINTAIKHIAPFLDIFGKQGNGEWRDFHWEREWRYPGDLTFEHNDVVLGLCTDDDLQEFKTQFPGISFVSPYMSMEEIIRKTKK